ncbi:MAG TPA: S9 family peptidase [Opitutaceae bacterium]|nr:S9 family peptidase [Opitutaceae bacterium]
MQCPRLAAGLLALPLALGAATPVPSIEDLARAPRIAAAALSPDGEYIAFLSERSGRTTLFISDLLERTGTVYVEPGHLAAREDGPAKETKRFQWISDRRLAFTTAIWDYYTVGTSAVDRDGRDWVALSGYEVDQTGRGKVFNAVEILHAFADRDASVLMADRSDRLSRPHVARVNTRTGSIRRVVTNPGNVTAWVPDREGFIRAGVTSQKEKVGVIYREKEGDEWRALPALDEARGEAFPLGFDAAGLLYLSALTDNRRWGIYTYDLTAEKLEGPVLAEALHDIVPPGRTPVFYGVPLVGPIFSGKDGSLIGVRFVTDAPRVVWFDPEFAALQNAVDELLPGKSNLITSRTKDDGKLLILSFADRSPGTYYILTRSPLGMKPFGPAMPWINPAQLAQTFPVKFKARDGLDLHGYVTLPPRRLHQNLPVVVLPHGGPWVRDSWGFDPLVQLLATRGYAVLQVNYRGSIGYGQNFSDAGRRQVGHGIQQDIDDGARWLVARGVADPGRIAIVGGSYGGYSALFALGRSPELYRCGVSIAGVSDWLGIFRQREAGGASTRFWKEQIGDPETEESRLREISPLYFADRIRAPVLLIHGKDDDTVPVEQTRAMAAALQRAGRKPEVRTFGWQMHWFASANARKDTFTAVLDFLGRHLGPGAAELPAEAGPQPAGAPVTSGDGGRRDPAVNTSS